MEDPKGVTQKDKWLRLLAGEVMAALAEAGKKRSGFDEESLAQAMAQKQGIQSLIDKAEQVAPQDTAGTKKERDYERLVAKYNEVSEEFRHLESHCGEIEEAFQQLAGVLASLAHPRSKDDGLSRELKTIKQVLRQKTVPSRLYAAHGQAEELYNTW